MNAGDENIFISIPGISKRKKKLFLGANIVSFEENQQPGFYLLLSVPFKSNAIFISG
jgi:hypothetical protein